MIELLEPAILYPEDDGRPMADNTKQYRWIETIKGGLERLFLSRDDVFIAGNLLWYPVEGRNRLRRAPDAMIAFGRPRGDRSSYLQWNEDNIAPQVVFEVLSPNNTKREMHLKLRFYDRFGVEEYYLYDPDDNVLKGWIRKGKHLSRIVDIERGFVSPRLGVHFEVKDELEMTTPDGWVFVEYRVAHFQQIEERRQRELAEAKADDEVARRIASEIKQAKAEKQRVQMQALAEMERKRFEELLNKLKAKGINPDTLS